MIHRTFRWVGGLGIFWLYLSLGNVPSIINGLFLYFDGVLVIHDVVERILSRLKTNVFTVLAPRASKLQTFCFGKPKQGLIGLS